MSYLPGSHESVCFTSNASVFLFLFSSSIYVEFKIMEGTKKVKGSLENCANTFVTTSFEIYLIFSPICPLPLLMLVHIMYQMLKDIIHLLHYRSTTMDTEMLYSGYNFVSVSTKGFFLFSGYFPPIVLKIISGMFLKLNGSLLPCPNQIRFISFLYLNGESIWKFVAVCS